MNKIIEGFTNNTDYELLDSSKNCYIFKVKSINMKMKLVFDDTNQNNMSIEFEEL